MSKDDKELHSFAKAKNIAMSAEKKYSNISIRVELDEQKIPANIQWRSDDHPENNDYQDCKAFSLALFEKEYKETLKIDLWTKDFQVAEMDRFIYNNIKGLTETYQRATKNKQLVGAMRQFVKYFGEETGILEKPES